MTRLVNDMLFLSSADTESFDIQMLQMSPVELPELLKDISDSFILLFQERKIQFEFNSNKILPIWGDETKLRQAVCILLDNALEYTSVGGDVSLSAYTKLNEIIIAISDSGTDIPDKHKLFIFDRFY